MTKPLTRRTLWVTVTATAVAALTGCGRGKPSTDEMKTQLDADVKALPGVTGGRVDVFYASLTPQVICRLTSSDATKAAAVSTLDAALRLVAARTAPLEGNGEVTAEVVGQGVTGNVTDLGLPSRLTLADLRAR